MVIFYMAMFARGYLGYLESQMLHVWNIYLYIYPKNGTNVGKYTIHRAYSYGHLPVITGYKWDYTFYKWGFISTYN